MKFNKCKCCFSKVIVLIAFTCFFTHLSGQSLSDSIINNKSRVDTLNFDLSDPYSTNVASSKIDSSKSVFQLDTLRSETIFSKDIKVKKVFNPSPKKAMIYSLIFPGLGQIYNRKYWKLPIVYGGFMGVAYAVSWNGGLYGDYKKAYKDIVLNPYGTNSWHNFVSNPNEVLNNPSLLQQQKDRLKRQRDYFRRNRDLAIIVGVGLYVLCLIDAYVDASLYNFNVSPNLSMSATPTMWQDNAYSSKPVIGLQCSFTIK